MQAETEIYSFSVSHGLVACNSFLCFILNTGIFTPICFISNKFILVLSPYLPSAYTLFSFAVLIVIVLMNFSLLVKIYKRMRYEEKKEKEIMVFLIFWLFDFHWWFKFHVYLACLTDVSIICNFTMSVKDNESIRFSKKVQNSKPNRKSVNIAWSV